MPFIPGAGKAALKTADIVCEKTPLGSSFSSGKPVYRIAATVGFALDPIGTSVELYRRCREASDACSRPR